MHAKTTSPSCDSTLHFKHLHTAAHKKHAGDVGEPTDHGGPQVEATSIDASKVPGMDAGMHVYIACCGTQYV